MFSVVGHRGFMARYPENSLESFAQAEAAHVAEIELDVRRSSDGHLVVIHDPTLERTSRDSGPGRPRVVARMSLAELREIPLESGLPVPTLQEVCEATTTTLQVEVKEPSCVGALARFMSEFPAVAKRVQFMSFDLATLVSLKSSIPKVPRGLNVSGGEQVADVLARLDRIDAARVGCHWDSLTPELVEAVHASGREVHVWPLRTSAEVARAVAWRVDGGTTDDPGAVKAWLAELPRVVDVSQRKQVSRVRDVARAGHDER